MLIVIVQMDLNISGHTERREADKFDCRRHFGMKTKNEKRMYSECVQASCYPADFSFISMKECFCPKLFSETRKIIRASKLQILLP